MDIALTDDPAPFAVVEDVRSYMYRRCSHPSRLADVILRDGAVTGANATAIEPQAPDEIPSPSCSLGSTAEHPHTELAWKACIPYLTVIMQLTSFEVREGVPAGQPMSFPQTHPACHEWASRGGGTAGRSSELSPSGVGARPRKSRRGASDGGRLRREGQTRQERRARWSAARRRSGGGDDERQLSVPDEVPTVCELPRSKANIPMYLTPPIIT